MKIKIGIISYLNVVNTYEQNVVKKFISYISTITLSED